MVVIKCSNNGFIAVICDNLLRVYNLKQSKILFKYDLCDDLKTDSSSLESEDKQFSDTTFSYGCCFSNSGNFLAAFCENKDLVVWRTAETETDWKQIGKRKVAKRPTAMLVTNKEDHIVVSDKAGDVYSYSLCEGLPNETLLLGHVSMILDMAISNNDQYLITADRDEKIRVSCFPNSYNIKTFCLGHKEYVMQVLILETSPGILVSASGDGTVRFWDFVSGEAIHVETFEDKCPNKPMSIISCLACSKQDSIVFIGLKGSSMLHTVKVTTENKVQCVSPAGIVLDGSPCSLTVDHNNCLWVVQFNKDQPVVVFEMKTEGDNYKFNRLTCPTISILMSTEGWDLLYAGLKQMPCFENLKKKEGPGTSEYFDRKKNRIEEKRKKNENAEEKSLDGGNCINVKRFKT